MYIYVYRILHTLDVDTDADTGKDTDVDIWGADIYA